MQLRQMTAQDIAQVVRIAEASPEAAQWSAASYATLLENPSQVEAWVAERDDVVVGFVLIRIVEQEAEILNLAVCPESRRQGCGSRLMEQVLERTAADRAERIFLEVRASNTGALRFYERFLFRQIGTRPDYYPTHSAIHREDAIVLARDLVQAVPKPSEAPPAL